MTGGRKSALIMTRSRILNLTLCMARLKPTRSRLAITRAATSGRTCARFPRRTCATRVMIEEMRHGWQMCALLIDFFGETGKIEAKKMLDRRAYENKRLLGSFNEECDNWLDFFAFTDFIDRDGKFQLQMLKYSAFAP